MEEFTEDELRMILFVIRNRIRYESKRPAFVQNGHDLQNQKVWTLQSIREKIEAQLLSR